MDGLSAAASGMAVVSLAIQLVGSVRDIRRFMRQVSDAPKELNRLIDLLEQLEVIIEGVGELIEKQRRSAGDGDIDVSPNVLRAMKTCESRLARIEDVVEKARKGAKNKAIKSLRAFRIAYQKRDIEELEGQLRDAVSILNLTMTMNLTAVHSHNTDRLMGNVAETIRKHMVHSGTGPTNVNLPSNNRACARRGAGMPISGRQSLSLVIYENILGSVYIRRASKSIVFQDDSHRSSEEVYERIESTWMFIPSLFSLCIELRFVNLFGSIQSSLRTYPLISDDHLVWGMCKTNDVEGIQRLFSNCQVSPFSISPYGWTLLHEATFWLAPEACRLLFNLGLSGDETDRLGRRPFSSIISKAELGAVRMTYDIFSAHSEEVTAMDFWCDIFETGLIEFCDDRSEVVREIVNEFVSEQNVNEFHHSPLLFSMEVMLRTSMTAHGTSDEWMDMTRRLVVLGADIHRLTEDNSTLFTSILRLADHPFDSTYVGDVWLDTLRGVGVNDSEYLEAELMHDAEYWNTQSEEPLIILHWKVSEEANKCRISWDWRISPESSVFDVLNEFKHFGPTQHSVKKDYYHPKNLYNWPYVYPDWKYLEECDDERGYIPNHARLQRVKTRFKRHEQQRALKLEKAQGPHQSPNMPGSWIY